MKSMMDLKKALLSIDRRGYPAYKDTKGCYRFEGYILGIDHVQADPFAPPSRLHIRLTGEEAGFPAALYQERHKRVALQDYLTRLFGKEIDRYCFKAGGSGKSGLLSVSRCGQEVLERTACVIDPADGSVKVRLSAGFPANGRTIAAQGLIRMLFEFLPLCVDAVLKYQNLDAGAVRAVTELAEDQQFIREKLLELGLCAFVADGAVLPRESGVSQKPMKGATPFAAPPSMKVTLNLPHRGELSGMGIPKGITLIVGGGFHGKSTLLKALEMGVYTHIAGDGREYVITDESAVKIRAEDGRSVKNADISMFIHDLPGGRDTHSFSTEDASGSTSQAANVVEAMEAGASLFLIDEDTCATNFMVRDALMQRVVHRDQEPIIPFVERIRHLYEAWGISCIIVVGSSGLFFQVADRVVQMDCYYAKEITQLALREARTLPDPEWVREKPAGPSFDRRPRPDPAARDGRFRIKGQGKSAVVLEKQEIDLSHVEQLADAEQTVTLGYLLKYAQGGIFDGKTTLREAVVKLMEMVERQGLEELDRDRPTDLAMVRAQEIFACINRYRALRL